MNIAYAALQNIALGTRGGSNQFSIKTAAFTDSYLTDSPHYRSQVLSLLYHFSHWETHLKDFPPLVMQMVQTKLRTGEVCGVASHTINSSNTRDCMLMLLLFVVPVVVVVVVVPVVVVVVRVVVPVVASRMYPVGFACFTR
jgi:hypothetical protein